MKAFLGVAIGLHALLLLAGARFTPVSAHDTPSLSEATVELDLGAPPKSARAEAPRPAPSMPIAHSTTADGRAAGRGSTKPVSGGAVLVQSDAPPPPPVEPPAPETLDSWLRAYGERVGVRAAVPVNVGTGAVKDGEGTGTAESGSGDGGGLKGAGKHHGTAWGEGWDHVATEKAGERETVVTEAPETTLSKGAIAGGVAKSYGRIQQCFTDGVRRDPSFSGRLTVRFTIDASGAVTLTRDGGSTMGDPTVIRCVLAAFTTMRFPARAGSEPVQASHLVAYPPG